MSLIPFSTCSQSQPRIFFASEELFFLNLQTVYLCFSSTWILCSLLVIPFSICLMIWHFCISFVFFTFRLTAIILTQAFLIQNKTFTLCKFWLQSNFRISNVFITFEYSNIEHFCSISCVNGPLDGKKFEIERETVARDQDFCSR